ncbi:MAG: cupin domain-containing protein [Deltaproteobacteria bacterium]|nr:cupin domain-containing protein [Deltaproteobacteria bacterium]
MAITAGQLNAQTLPKLESAAVDELNRELQWHFGRVALEVQRRRNQKRLYVPAEESRLGGGDLSKRLIIAPELGFDIYAFYVFTDGIAARTERQDQIEGDTVKYYLSGRGVDVIGDQRIEVKAGDFIHIPANTWHRMENPNNEPLRFLAWQQIPGTFRQRPAPSIDRGGPAPEVPWAKDLTDQELQRLDPRELHRVYMKAQMEWGQVLQEVQRRRGEKRLHVPSEKAPLMEWTPGRSHMIIGPEYGFDIYAFHLFMVALAPGGRAGDDKGHFHGDAVKYYISGHGHELVGEERIEVKAGDFVHIPAYIWHLTVNGSTEEPLRYLAAQQFPGTYRLVSTPWQWFGRRERKPA